jgi:hypothetical protein
MKPTRKIHDVVIQVKELKEECPVYRLGDVIYIGTITGEEWVIDSTKSSVKRFCVSAFSSLIGEMIKVRHGLLERHYVRCLDPGPPYTRYSCVFEIRRAKGEGE